MISDGINFVLKSVVNPALECEQLSDGNKRILRNNRDWINGCKKIGDLDFLIEHYSENERLCNELEELNFNSYSTIKQNFRKEFRNQLTDCFRLTDFEVGKTYTARDICIVARALQIQEGIHFVNGEDRLEGIIIKVTFSGGRYDNTWIEEGEVLKYYFYSKKGIYSEEYRKNKVLLESGEDNVPIYVFAKQDNGLDFVGIFRLKKYGVEENPALTYLERPKFFVLKKVSRIQEVGNGFDAYVNEQRREEIAVRGLSEKELKYRIQISPKKTIVKSVVQKVYNRSPYIVEAVLRRANGICERCLSPAPFKKASDGRPYLEVHHLIPLSEGGEDSLDNTRALCPNCHRELHFGVRREKK